MDNNIKFARGDRVRGARALGFSGTVTYVGKRGVTIRHDDGSESGRLFHEIEREADEIGQLRAKVAEQSMEIARLLTDVDQLAADSETLVRLTYALEVWTHTYGSLLKPRGADTYGEGKRDAKDEVRDIIEAVRNPGKKQ
jgi:hypothetical protein